MGRHARRHAGRHAGAKKRHVRKKGVTREGESVTRRCTSVTWPRRGVTPRAEGVTRAHQGLTRRRKSKERNEAACRETGRHVPTSKAQHKQSITARKIEPISQRDQLELHVAHFRVQ